jgi:hypothetical protein
LTRIRQSLALQWLDLAVATTCPAARLLGLGEVEPIPDQTARLDRVLSIAGSSTRPRHSGHSETCRRAQKRDRRSVEVVRRGLRVRPVIVEQLEDGCDRLCLGVDALERDAAFERNPAI